MAVNLETDYNGRLWNKYHLELCDAADAARIQAGKDWLRAAERAYLERTRDAYLTGFKPEERPWRAEFLPQNLQFETGRELPDYVHSYPGGNNDYANSHLVSPRLKALIEAQETDADGWQFFPVEILNKDGSEFGTYYVWWVHRVVDAIDESSEGVETVAGPIDGRHRWTYIGKKTPERLKLKHAVIEGLNAWIDFRFYARARIFISDSLFQAMREADMSGFAPDSIWSEV
jgi:hypothetical protein